MNHRDRINKETDATTKSRPEPKAVRTDGDLHERRFLATCQEIYNRYSNPTATFETFVVDLIMNAAAGRWPTPDGDCGGLPFETFFIRLLISVSVGIWPTPDSVVEEAGADSDFRAAFDIAVASAPEIMKIYAAETAA